MNPRHRLPLKPLRDQYDLAPINAFALAQRLGWYDKRNNGGSAATSRVQRVLGITSQKGGRGWTGPSDTISVANARAICDALGLDIDELYDTELAAFAAPRQPSPRCACGVTMLEPADECGFCIAEAERGLAA